MGRLPERKEVGAQVRELREKHLAISRIVRENTGQAQRRQKLHYDLRVKGDPIEKGDVVMYRSIPLNPGEMRSFRMAYGEKQYTVVEKLSDVNYRITDGGKPKVVHFNQLKLIKRAEDSAGEAEPGNSENQVENPENSPVRRSERSKKPPAHLQDYVVEKPSSHVL